MTTMMDLFVEKNSWESHIRRAYILKNRKSQKKKKLESALEILVKTAATSERVSEEICKKKKFETLLDACNKALDELEDEEFEEELYAEMNKQQEIDRLKYELAQIEKCSDNFTRDIYLVNIGYEIKKIKKDFPIELITKIHNMLIENFGWSMMY